MSDFNRSKFLVNVLYEFGPFFCSQENNCKWRSYQAERPLVLDLRPEAGYIFPLSGAV